MRITIGILFLFGSFLIRANSVYIDTSCKNNQVVDPTKKAYFKLDAIKKLQDVIREKYLTIKLPKNAWMWGLYENIIDNFAGKENRLREEYADFLALEFCLIYDDVYVAVVFPCARSHDEEIVDIFQQYGEIIYKKEAKLTKNGPVNLLKLLYQDEAWIGTPKNYFKGARKDSTIRFPEDALEIIKIYLIQCESLARVKECKAVIRSIFGIGNYSIHVHDYYHDAIRIAQGLFNSNSIHFLNYAGVGSFDGFQGLLKEYKKWQKYNEVDGNRCCIDGSAVLAAYGIRMCRDLDFLQYGYDLSKLSKLPSLVEAHNHEVLRFGIQPEEIIYNPKNFFYYQGLKIMSLADIKKIKKRRGEAKDKRDIAAIEGFLAT